MKGRPNHVVLGVGLAFIVISARAQSFTNLHNFAVAKNGANSDGANPYSQMVLSGNTLYGTAAGDDTNGLGGLFKINTDGTGFSNFFSFSFVNSGVNGSNPFGGLALSGDTLYGTTRNGGTNFTGSIFAIKTDGTGFTNLYQFKALVANKNADGSYPEAALVLFGSTLYGTTYSGGSNGLGTVFAVSTSGTGFTNLVTFNGTNGQNPEATLTLSGENLYGTTYSGGDDPAHTNGTIFSVNTKGQGFTNLHSFSKLGFPFLTNADGANPQGGLAISGDTLYGSAPRGGTVGNGYGMLFAVHTDGSGFTNIFNFSATNGGGPYSDLILTNNVLYGTTSSGVGSDMAGTVFKINTDGTGFAHLYGFPLPVYSGSAYTNSTGAEPWAGVVLTHNTLFGVTPTGGLGGTGTIFAVGLTASGFTPIPLNAQVSSGSLVLNWSNPSFSLQASLTLAGPFTNIPNASSPYTIIATNTQSFFRLLSN